MAGRRQFQKDHLAGLLLVAMGIAILVIGQRYRIGTPAHMGAGFIPVVLGVIMTLVGLAVGLLAGPGTAAERATGKRHALADLPDLRGGFCILAGVGAFVLFGLYGGLVPATFASVFVAALGDRQNTVKSAALLAVGMVVFGTIVFHWGLRLQLPLFTWG